MKNLELNINRIINSINGEITTASIKSSIEEWYSACTYADTKQEAEKYFSEYGPDWTVESRESQRFQAGDFEIVVNEYYADSGSSDYVYSIQVYDKVLN
jgi:hypothetical protein